MRVKTTLQLLVVSLLVSACADTAETSDATDWASQFADAEVGRVYQRMMDTMAPDNGWERARYIQWDWVRARPEAEDIPRSHRWDRYEGTYRFESTGRNGHMIAILNVNDPETGQVWLDGVEQSGEELSNGLTSAYRSFINDSYWLLMPYKWADPGVTASYLGMQTDDQGREWEAVELTFESVGLTPQNKYNVFVNPESGLVERWSHWSNAENPEPNFTLGWTDWQWYGPIQLASQRPNDEGFSSIYMGNVMVSETLPDGVFDPPAANEAPGA